MAAALSTLSRPADDDKPFRLLDLPPELRNRIYDFVQIKPRNLIIYRGPTLERSSSGWYGWRISKHRRFCVAYPYPVSVLNPQLLRVNRQINSETAAMLYDQVFDCDRDFPEFLATIGEANGARIRHVKTPRGMSWSDRASFDSLRRLPHLKTINLQGPFDTNHPAKHALWLYRMGRDLFEEFATSQVSVLRSHRMCEGRCEYDQELKQIDVQLSNSVPQTIVLCSINTSIGLKNTRTQQQWINSSGSLMDPGLIKHSIREARRHIFPFELLPEELQGMIVGYAVIKLAELLPGNVQYTSFAPGAATYSLAGIGPLAKVNRRYRLQSAKLSFGQNTFHFDLTTPATPMAANTQYSTFESTFSATSPASPNFCGVF